MKQEASEKLLIELQGQMKTYKQLDEEKKLEQRAQAHSLLNGRLG